jgi:hypothetical protein
MGNRVGLILKYNEYIDNITIKNQDDDVEIFNDMLRNTIRGSFAISEGLIKTHPIDKSVDIIKRRFPNVDVSTEDDGEIVVSNLSDKLSVYNILFTNLGYFISLVDIDNKWNKVVDLDKVVDAVILEPKYDIKVAVPKSLYHASPLKYKDKILSNGLILKALSKVSLHPDRIYLTDDLMTCKMFASNLPKDKLPFYQDGYCIYSIDTNYIDDLYSDINLRKSGYYVDYNIPPNAIKLVFSGKL